MSFSREKKTLILVKKQTSMYVCSSIKWIKTKNKQKYFTFKNPRWNIFTRQCQRWSQKYRHWQREIVKQTMSIRNVWLFFACNAKQPTLKTYIETYIEEKGFGR